MNFGVSEYICRRKFNILLNISVYGKTSFRIFISPVINPSESRELIMIQRIQSIFLLLASGSAFSLFLDPMSFFEVDNKEGLTSESTLFDGIFNVHDHIIMLVTVVLAGAAALTAIFLFKNRKTQMTVSRLVIVLGVVIAVLAAILFWMDYKLLQAGTEIEAGFGLLSPILTIIFAALANHFINKDEKLVKSMDRLR